MRPKKIQIPIYDGCVTFLLGMSIAEANRIANIDMAADTSHGATYRHETRRSYFIWTEKQRDLGTLVHECVHAAHWILADVGVKTDPQNHEAMAYLVDWLFVNSGVRL